MIRLKNTRYAPRYGKPGPLPTTQRSHSVMWPATFLSDALSCQQISPAFRQFNYSNGIKENELKNQALILTSIFSFSSFFL